MWSILLETPLATLNMYDKTLALATAIAMYEEYLCIAQSFNVT